MARFGGSDRSVIATGEADCPSVYPDLEMFWKASMSAGPFQVAKGIVGEDDLRTAVFEAVAPYRTDEGGLRFENVFRYVTAKPQLKTDSPTRK